MQVVETIEALRGLLADRPGIGVVPTMGNLHAGHIELVRQSRARTRITVVTLFVNRLQFGPREDFDRYPRTFAADCALLAREGADYLFAPDEKELYPHPQSVMVQPGPDIGDILEGEFRPGFFVGVATVVLKLFGIVQPRHAFFGKKDYQQVRVIERMVRELNLPINVVAVDTIRADDGLALSSRNSYLSGAERQEAARLYRTLHAAAASIVQGTRPFAEIEDRSLESLRAHGWQPDYIAVRRQRDLAVPIGDDRALVILAAARLGNTRLIDNIELSI